jgi:hypothetical protein
MNENLFSSLPFTFPLARLLLNMAFHTTRTAVKGREIFSLYRCTINFFTTPPSSTSSLFFHFSICIFIFLLLFQLSFAFANFFLLIFQSLFRISTLRLRNPKFRAAKFMNATNSGSPFARISFSTTKQNVLGDVITYAFESRSK